MIEIPEGSIPVGTIDYTKSHTVRIGSGTNKVIETFFYFPEAGTFKVYPANVSKNGKVMAQAVEREIKVELSRKMASFDNFGSVLAHGKEEDIIGFIRSKNIFDEKIFKVN